VNAVTRAGTNQYHGLGFGYSGITSSTRPASSPPVSMTGLKRSQYGGPLAANREEPDVLLRVDTRERTEAAGQRSGPCWCRRAMRSGDFSGSRAPLRNPFTGALFPNKPDPDVALQPRTVKIVNVWLPLPNPVGTDNPLTARFASRRTTTIIRLAALDHSFTDKHRVVRAVSGSRVPPRRPCCWTQYPQQRVRRTWQKHGGRRSTTPTS